ncbi:hypothetical protein [uncultured Mediterranean phage]|nr:hypothetical protein [uncultured Mediterranean phage]
MWGVLSAIAPALIQAYLYNRGANQVEGAMESSSNLANVAADIFQRQAAQDMPYRKNMYDALVRRSQKQFPRILPTQNKAALNPLRGGARPSYQQALRPAGGTQGPTSSNSPTFASVLDALTRSRQG